MAWSILWFIGESNIDNRSNIEYAKHSVEDEVRVKLDCDWYYSKLIVQVEDANAKEKHLLAR